MPDYKGFLIFISYVAQLRKSKSLVPAPFQACFSILLRLVFCFGVLTGFAYEFCRYIRVGNAVAVPVGIALGYAFGMASQGLSDDQPIINLPFKYPKYMHGNADEHSD